MCAVTDPLGTLPSPAPADLRRDVRALCAEWSASGRYVARSDAWLRSPNAEFSKELARGA